MNTRLALFDLARRHAVPRAGVASLVAAARLSDPPAGLQAWMWRGVAVLAAALLGLGLILWLAANWETLGRTGRFALLQTVVLVACVAAAWRPPLRAPASLVGLLAIGALFAYFGQTYQTGADAWQLFALWAVLALPLCAGARSDVAWAPWAVVAMTAIALWTFAHTGHRWRVEARDLGTFGAAWLAAGVVAVAMSSAFSRWTGAGPWAFRTAVTLAVVAIGLGALGALFASRVAPHYGLGVGVLVLAALVLAHRRAFDVFAISAVALALDALLVAGAARFLFDGAGRDPFGPFLATGLLAAALLAGSVHVILRLARERAPAEEAQ